MKRVKTWLNATDFPVQGEKQFSPSKTVPDQTMSMRELLDRYARGLPLAGAKEPMYYGEEDLPDLNRLDLAEIQELKEANKQRIADQQADLQRQRDAKAKKTNSREKPSLPGDEGDKGTGAAGKNSSGSEADGKKA